MTNQRIVLLSSLSVIGFLVFFYFYWNGGENERNFLWYEDYENKGDEPYGTFILYELLKDKYAGKFVSIQRPIREVLDEERKTNTNYVFVGQKLHFGKNDLNKMTDYVKRGNTAFLSVKYFPDELIEFLQDEACDGLEVYFYEDLESVNLGLFDKPITENDEELDFTYRVRKQEQTYYWEYFAQLDCETPYEELGYIEAKEEEDYYSNFVRIKYGKGYFYLHTTPLAFSNFHLVDKKKLLYADQVFASLSNGKLYWDEHSKVSYSNENEPSRSPLKYILAQPSLRWAWYLLLLGVVIYFVFYSKRRQRAIPILPANINSSIEFAETTGRLYYQSENHFKLSKHIYNLFLTDLRRHYNVQLSEVNPAVFERISLKTGVPIKVVKEIFDLHQRFEFKKNISQEELIHFHQLIELFHKQRK
ncbi:MAG: hypothetical protein NW226_01720 [Microscillaceae bacterium]|nr:hypothetical protein [Microscillaceae bacterium]